MRVSVYTEARKPGSNLGSRLQKHHLPSLRQGFSWSGAHYVACQCIDCLASEAEDPLPLPPQCQNDTCAPPYLPIFGGYWDQFRSHLLQDKNEPTKLSLRAHNNIFN